MADASAAANFFNHLLGKYGTSVFVVKFKNDRYGYAACQNVGKGSLYVVYVKGKGTEEEPFLPDGQRVKLSFEKGEINIEDHKKLETEKSLKSILDGLSKGHKEGKSIRPFWEED